MIALGDTGLYRSTVLNNFQPMQEKEWNKKYH